MTERERRSVSKPSDFGRVALLVGGDSAEREVSLNGGEAVSRALRRQKIRHEIYDGTVELFDAILAGRVDRVFNLMHGPGGEDGAVQGALQLMKIPVTGSGVLGSALTMDKARSKWLLQRHGIPTAPFVLLTGDAGASAVPEELGRPLFVKPNGLGSSIGVSRVTSEEALADAIALARDYGSEVLVESAVEGKEYFAGVIGDTALPLIRIETPRAFYDYQAKYESDDTRYYCPCGLDAEAEKDLQARSLQVFELLGASGWGRVDFIVDASGEAWFLEINTAPGMTDHSLVPQAAEQIGIGFDELVWRILETSL